MSAQGPAQDTPFASSQYTQLSPDAPEFVAPAPRSRSHSLLKAKDSVSSMTETEAPDGKAPPAGERTELARLSGGSSSREAVGAQPQQRSQDLDTDSGAASGGEGSSQSAGAAKAAARGGGILGSGARPPSSRRGGSLPGAHGGGGGRRQPPASPQHGPFPDAGYGRLPVPLGPPAYHYPGQAFAPPQLYPMPLAGHGARTGQMLFPPGSPIMLPPWQHAQPYVPLLMPEPYQGYAAQLGMAPQLAGGYYGPSHVGYGSEHFAPAHDPHMGAADWGLPQQQQQGLLDSHAYRQGGRPASQSSSLNAGAARFTPDNPELAAARAGGRSIAGPAAGPYGGGHRRGPSSDGAAQQPRAAEGEAPAPGRQAPLTSDRPRRHRRSPSVPVTLPSAAAAAAADAAPEAGQSQPGREASGSAAAAAAPQEEREPAAPRKRGHRRQASLPTVSDMERLREGGGGHRRGRHSRSESWFSGSGRASALLEEFKASREGSDGRKWSLADVKGHVIEFCKDQAGSRFIQQALEDPETPPEQIAEVAAEARPRFASLTEDVFGNYVIQKLLERAGPADRAWMAERLRGGEQQQQQPGRGSGTGGGGSSNRAVSLSRHQYGCRVVQKALETLELGDRVAIMGQLLGSVLDLVADQNGNHVIQKCVECIKPTAHIEPLINELLSGRDSHSIPPLRGEVVPLSQHMYGCRVVQRLLEHCSAPEAKARFMGAILADVLPLSRNIYSNYVIQHVLEYGEPAERDRVLGDLAGHTLLLARDKFASNVVERCLKHGSPAQRAAIVAEFLGSEAAFVQVMRDDYGNYVAFSTYEFADAEQRQALADVIRRNVAPVRRTSFGKNFHSKLAEKYPDVFGDLAVHGGRGQAGARGPGPRGGRQQQQQQQPARSQPQLQQQPPPQQPQQQQQQPQLTGPISLGSGGAAPPPQRLLSPRRGEREAPKQRPPPSKAEADAGKAPAGQVSVMADGANPALFPLPPVSSAPASQEEAVAAPEAPQPLVA